MLMYASPASIPAMFARLTPVKVFEYVPLVVVGNPVNGITTGPAAAGGAHLRVVAAAPQVRRILALTRADRELDTYPDLAAALGGRPGPAVRARAWPG